MGTDLDIDNMDKDNLEINKEVIIEVKDVSYRYRGNDVLSDIEFNVHRGEYLGILGPNGGGKTTLLKILLGLLTPDTGVVKLFGEPSLNFIKRELVGYVPQSNNGLSFPATVEEIVASGRTPKVGYFSRLSNVDRDAINSAMETAGVIDLKKRLVSELSGGERQRAYIARALATEPEVLILDEPSVGVDVGAQEVFYSFLAELNSKRDMTILFVSHDVGVVAREVGTLLCLNQRMVCHGRPENIIKGNFLEMVYGSHMKSVYHRHD